MSVSLLPEETQNLNLDEFKPQIKNSKVQKQAKRNCGV